MQGQIGSGNPGHIAAHFYATIFELKPSPVHSRDACLCASHRCQVRQDGHVKATVVRGREDADKQTSLLWDGIGWSGKILA